jgi:hypothetical protein
MHFHTGTCNLYICKFMFCRTVLFCDLVVLMAGRFCFFMNAIMFIAFFVDSDVES